MDIIASLNYSLEELRKEACESTCVSAYIRELAPSSNLVVDEKTCWAFRLGQLGMLYQTIDTLWDGGDAELQRTMNTLFAKADEISLILTNKKPTEPFCPFDL